MALLVVMAVFGCSVEIDASEEASVVSASEVLTHAPLEPLEPSPQAAQPQAKNVRKPGLDLALNMSTALECFNLVSTDLFSLGYPGVTFFGQVIVEAAPARGYGCYCGQGSAGLDVQPVDAIDACCRQHDIDWYAIDEIEGGCNCYDHTPELSCTDGELSVPMCLPLCEYLCGLELQHMAECFRAAGGFANLDPTKRFPWGDDGPKPIPDDCKQASPRPPPTRLPLSPQDANLLSRASCDVPSTATQRL